jgi:hypothetical protein
MSDSTGMERYSDAPSPAQPGLARHLSSSSVRLYAPAEDGRAEDSLALAVTGRRAGVRRVASSVILWARIGVDTLAALLAFFAFEFRQPSSAAL